MCSKLDQDKRSLACLETHYEEAKTQRRKLEIQIKFEKVEEKAEHNEVHIEKEIEPLEENINEVVDELREKDDQSVEVSNFEASD